jgi:O-6-methylguanine DNA methyltransferase
MPSQFSAYCVCLATYLGFSQVAVLSDEPPQRLSAELTAQVDRLFAKWNRLDSPGSAVGKNNLAYLIPCHRVIRETGVIGDYRWGRSRKRAIVAWESSKETVGRRYA